MTGAIRTESAHFQLDLEGADGSRHPMPHCRLGLAPHGPVSDTLQMTQVDGVIGFEVFRRFPLLISRDMQRILLLPEECALLGRSE